MPNLHQIFSLKEEFYHLSISDKRVKDYLELSETKDVIIKAFDSLRLNESIGETRMYSFINENLNPSKPGMIEYFDEGKEEVVALLFIDITSFSKTISGWSNIRMKNYLDSYYNRIIPIIYENGGAIEKLMGDGIICVFGKPFLDLDSHDYVYKAEQCAEAAIKEFYNTNKNVKVAIHQGKINYYKVPGEHYGEYTMIGQPVTDLYRLESISKPNAINFYTDSLYDKLGWTSSMFDNKAVRCGEFEFGNLQGVDFTHAKFIKFPGYY